MATVSLVGEDGSELGECPVWDSRDGCLYWIDAANGLLNSSSGASRGYLPRPLGSVATRRAGGFVIAGDESFWLTDPSGHIKLLATLPREALARRINDGKCDPAGRFWAGTAAQDGNGGANGALYRLSADGELVEALGGVAMSNGLGWSPDGQTFYYIDTPTRRIDAFDFDVATGALSGRRTFAVMPSDSGVPDGLAVDAEGGVWVAMWGGWCIRRYASDGKLEDLCALPVSQVTSCAFGGDRLQHLYATTAWRGLAETARKRQPLAGRVFRVSVPVRGTPVGEFGG